MFLQKLTPLKIKNWIKNKIKYQENRVQTSKLHKLIKLDKYKVIYFPVPKVACSTYKYIFAKLLEIENIDNLSNYEIHCLKFPSVKRSDLFEYQDYYKFGFVRNPWDRLFSCYKSKIKSDPNYNKGNFQNGISKRFIKYNLFRAGMSFDEFVKAVSQIPDEPSDFHFKSQYLSFVDKKGNSVVNFIGHYESISEDWQRICSESDLPTIELPHLNQESSFHYSQYYTQESIDLVSTRYAEDIKKLNYTF